MNWFRILAVILVIAVLLTALFVCRPKSVTFPDANLEIAIREAIDKPEDPISTSDLESLVTLDLGGKDILYLTGLEHCANLGILYLQDNNISDVSVLAGLTGLRWLSLDGNNISDVSALADLTNLEELNLQGNNISHASILADLTNLRNFSLSGNNISDISGLAGLFNLKELYLNDNNISDISVLAGLPNLERLSLSGNNISDISVLAGLPNLERIYLNDNNIGDISPLVANDAFSVGDTVYLIGNPLSITSLTVYVLQLEVRGVDVRY